MESPEFDLKKTVNLPKTDFPMKANLPQNEPKMLRAMAEVGHLRTDSAARAKAGRSTFCTTGRPMRTATSISGTRSTRR